jgi:O-antigen ligase
MWDHTISQIGFNSSKLNIFSEAHESHYKTAYKMFLDNKIMGVGIRNYRNFCNDEKYRVNNDSCTTHPHNTYIQLLSETGLIGFAFGTIIFFFFAFKVLQHLINAFYKKKFKFNDFEVCLMASILISIWPLAPTGNFFNNWISTVYYLPVGFFFWSIKNKS